MKLNGTDVSGTLDQKLSKQEPARTSTSGRLLIIGYGNPLRGDDGIGWRIADQLATLAGDSAKVLAVHQLTPELAEPIAGAYLVVFIDACFDGSPGDWTCETIKPDMDPSDAFTHHLTPPKLLSYASGVFGAKPRALLISIAGGSFDCGEELSPSVAAIVPEIVGGVGEWWNANQETPKKL